MLDLLFRETVMGDYHWRHMLSKSVVRRVELGLPPMICTVCDFDGSLMTLVDVDKAPDGQRYAVLRCQANSEHMKRVPVDQEQLDFLASHGRPSLAEIRGQ